MQYVLSKDEFDALVAKDEIRIRDQALAAAREKILALAGFDCIYTPGKPNYDGYCDDCPCSPIASGNDYSTWQLVCWLRKDYSK